ncbi:bifunctional PIG-L family deacetylase/class I SAM-dependent methyltransferase [Microbacterium sp. NPDC077184]|uniref:bifunctional PIG-L family deacetylase/class I SAM-dependent methyltransferase n=1 Tax=Microbacterium sp. NPDC077184 TaxID=3154764 RepID=UPI003423959F
MVTFDHRDPGTPESAWRTALAARALPEVSLDIDALLVIAAHPDDETLGVAGLLRTVAQRGIPIRVIIATDGENSHPESPTHTPADLATRRQTEVRDALAVVAPAATLRLLHLPDGTIGDHQDPLAAAVRDELAALMRLTDAASHRILIVAPWTGDGHRDHRIVGALAERVATEVGATVRGYPIWLWHWGTPADVPWDRVESVALDADAHDAKRRALAVHDSQLRPLSGAPGDEAIVHARMREHFDRAHEILLRPEVVRPEPPTSSTPRSHFEEFFATHDDPWGFRSSWYEQRKRDLLLATLPRATYDAGLELGCATGILTARLAERCAHLVAVDFSAEALAAAARELAGHDNVTLRTAALPQRWPEGQYDLVVLSEIGYFWNAADLDTAIDRITQSLAQSGHLVACHWRHPMPENPTGGDEVHDRLRANSRWQSVVVHLEKDFVLEVFSPYPASSVAQETGMLP